MPISQSVNSNQAGPNKHLKKVVERHLQTPFQKPYADHSLKAFEVAAQWLSERPDGPLILDSYCGVGESTTALARQYPHASIIGIDKSLHRLTKHDNHYRDGQASNYLLLRADVDDFWRQALEAGWQLNHHFLLYPNPWPKSSHLKRRCHGSPLFPTLLKLGGIIELRSNWAVYVEEFTIALQLAGFNPTHLQWAPTDPITPFERKYLAAHQKLWRCVCTLS